MRVRAAALGFHALYFRGVHASCRRLMPIIIISPAKSLNELPPPSGFPRTEPRFRLESAELAASAKKLGAAKLKSLMSVSDAIASLNARRFEAFDTARVKPCALAFDGPAYKALDAHSLTPEDVRFAQQHVRFLSGLYGVLRPTDAIAPHRLEMGTKLITKRGNTLYEYWGDSIADALAEDVRSLVPERTRFVVNCASAEYWKAAKQTILEKKHGVRVIACVFPGPAVYAKAARGAMCRHIVKNRVEDPEGLKTFVGVDGEWTFVREETDAKSGERFFFARRPAKAAGRVAPVESPKRAVPDPASRSETAQKRRSKRPKTVP